MEGVRDFRGLVQKSFDGASRHLKRLHFERDRKTRVGGDQDAPGT